MAVVSDPRTIADLSGGALQASAAAISVATTAPSTTGPIGSHSGVAPGDLRQYHNASIAVVATGGACSVDIMVSCDGVDFVKYGATLVASGTVELGPAWAWVAAVVATNAGTVKAKVTQAQSR